MIERLQRTYQSYFGDIIAVWVLEVFLVVFISLVADLALRKLLLRVEQRVATTRNPWDDAVVRAVRHPLSVLVWILGIAFAMDIARAETGVAIFNAVAFVRGVGVIAALAWFLMLLIRNWQEAYLSTRDPDSPADRATVESICKLLRVSVFITAVLVALQTLGFSISGLLAFGGIGGIAVGFAARDLLANFFGSIMIFLDRPFAVGEWIRSPDKEIEGTVEHISWRLTRIRTFDKRPLYVPNATFSSIAVENPSRMTHRRIYETIGIRYEDAPQMAAIVADVKAMLITHPEIDATQTMMVNFNKFAPSSLDFFIYTFTKTTVWTEFHTVKQDVLLKVIEIIGLHGAEVAFPTSTVHFGDELKLSGGAAKLTE